MNYNYIQKIINNLKIIINIKDDLILEVAYGDIKNMFQFTNN